MTLHPAHSDSSWEKRFDEKFGGSKTYSYFAKRPDEIKSFIHQIEKESYQKGLNDGRVEESIKCHEHSQERECVVLYGMPCGSKNPHAQLLGSIKSKKKALSSRLNGKKGGRPKKPKHGTK